MKLRIALAGIVAAAIAAVAAPTAAQAGPNDNNDARVAGVSSVAATEWCPEAHFCIYTGRDYTGRMFKLFRCQTYSLSNWNGVGSWWNRNSDNAHAYILDQNRRRLVDSAPYTFNGAYNFKPAWYVTAC